MEYGVSLKRYRLPHLGESYEHLLKMLEEAIQGLKSLAKENPWASTAVSRNRCIKSVSGKALCKIVEKFGWKLKRIVGSHHIYAKEQFEPISQFLFMEIEIYPLEPWSALYKDAGLIEADLS